MDCMQRCSNVMLQQHALTMKHQLLQVSPALQLTPACKNAAQCASHLITRSLNVEGTGAHQIASRFRQALQEGRQEL